MYYFGLFRSWLNLTCVSFVPIGGGDCVRSPDREGRKLCGPRVDHHQYCHWVTATTVR